MKTPRSISMFLAASTFAASSVFAQSVTSDAVGYISSTVYGNGGSGQRLTLVSPSFHNADLAVGTVSSSTSTTINVSSTLADSAYAGGQYYIEIVNSSGVGYWTDITSNDANSVTVNDDLTSFIADGDTFYIREHLTIGGLFGSSNSAGLQAGGDINAADNVQIISFSGGTSQNSTYWYSNVSGFEGWFDASFNASADAIVAPHEGVIISRKTTGDISVVFSGVVRNNDVNFPVEVGVNVIAVPSAATKTLATSGLSSYVGAGGDINSADNISIIGADGSNSTYWYSNVSGFEGWFDASFNDSSNVALTPGTSFILTRKSGNGSAFNAVMSSTY